MLIPIPSCWGTMGLAVCVSLIFKIQLVFGESESNETGFPAENQGPDVHLIAVKFFTKSAFSSEYTLNGTSKIFQIPVTFKEMTFSCESPFPTSWKFHKPPFEESSIQRISIYKHRDVTNLTEFETNSDSYFYRSNLTIKYKYFIDKRLWPIACKGSSSLGYGNHSTVIQGESYTHDPLRLRINISKFDDSVTYNERRQQKLGINAGCNVTLVLDKEQKKFACGLKGTNKMSRPGIISCRNKDECISIYMDDKKTSNCSDTFRTNCNHTECQSFPVDSQLPGVILCSDDSNKNSIARSFFTFPVRGKMGYEFWDESKPNISLHRVNGPDDEDGEADIFYYGQNVTFQCSASASFFSNGFQWVLTPNYSDTSKSPKIYLGNDTEDFLMDNMHSVKKTIKLEREYGNTIKVTCFGPRWNKIDWVNQSIEFKVSEPAVPIILGTKADFNEQETPNTCFNRTNCGGGMVVHLTNEGCITKSTTFHCEATGKPIPKFSWKVQKKDGKSVFESNTWNTHPDNACQSKSKVYETPRGIVVRSKLHLHMEMKSEYNVTCHAINFVGSEAETFECDESESTAVFYALIIGLLVALVIATSGGALGVYWMRRRGKNALLRISATESRQFEGGDPSADGAFALPYNSKKFEISPDEIELCMEQILGQGDFGIVVGGTYRNEKVAVKMVKPNSDLNRFRALLSEIKLMCFMDKHPHLVNMVGAYTINKQRGEAYLITEYCAKGNLLNYLKSAKTDSSCTITPVQMITWAYECACAMEYLSLKNFIHKDLAARNVLLTENLKAKIGDFGISKQLEDFSQQVYFQQTLTPLPLKWMAVESLRNLEFSIKTDVWSFGVLLWEIFSMGETPYPGLPHFGHDSYHLLLEGFRMNVPFGCSDEIYAIMRGCWRTEPAQRPTFSELREYCLSQLIETKVNTGTGRDLHYVNPHLKTVS